MNQTVSPRRIHGKLTSYDGMWNFFDRVIVVNLPHRQDRYKQTRRELARVGCRSVEFFPAIKPESRGDFPSIGARGCYLSHTAVLRKAVGLRNVLIVEDDVRFTRQFREHASVLLPRLPADWEILYLGHLPRHSTAGALEPPQLIRVPPEWDFLGAHLYAVNGPAIPKLIAIYDEFLSRRRDHPLGGPMPIDGALNVARRQLSLRTFAAVPPLALQRASRSNVAQVQWFDRTPAVRDAVRVLRVIKNLARVP